MLARFLYHSYAGFYTVRLWFGRHVTPVGAMAAAAVFLSFLLGFNVYKTTLYQVLALGISVMAVSAGVSLFPFRLRVRVDRILPDYATAGQGLVYEIQVTNLSSKPCKGLVLYEDINDPRPGFDTLTSRKEPFEQLRNAWDRKTMYYRWVWLLRKAAKARFGPIELPDLPAGETVKVRAGCLPLYRGMIYFTGCTFARPDALGLFSRLIRVKKAQTLMVLPQRYRLGSPALVSGRNYHAGGVSLASSIGNSDEFMSLRYYRPGDPMRNIHWRTFARTSELVIKEFQDEFFVRQALILDTFVPSDQEAVFEEAVRIAASYIGAIQTHESILDLMFMGSRVYSFSSGRGLACPEKMLEILSCVEPCEDKTILDLVPVLKANIKKISGSICIFSGWDTGHKKIFHLFEQANKPVLIIVLTDDKAKMEKRIFKDLARTPKIKVVRIGQIQQEFVPS